MIQRNNPSQAITIQVIDNEYASTTFSDIILTEFNFIEELRSLNANASTDNGNLLNALKNHCSPSLFKIFHNLAKATQTYILDSILKPLSRTKSDKELTDELFRLISRVNISIVNFLFTSRSTENTNLKLTNDVAFYFASYNIAINNAMTPIDKLFGIIDLVQSLEQLHPFGDANCRTFCHAAIKSFTDAKWISTGNSQ